MATGKTSTLTFCIDGPEGAGLGLRASGFNGATAVQPRIDAARFQHTEQLRRRFNGALTESPERGYTSPMRALKPSPPRLKCPRFVVVVAVALMMSGCTLTTVRTHPDLAQRRLTIRSVAVFPPQVDIVQIGLNEKQKEPLPEVTAGIQGRLPGLIATELTSRGLVLKDAGLHEAVLADQPDLRARTTAIADAYARASSEMFKESLMERAQAHAYRVSLGREVSGLAERAQVDALVLVRMEGFKKSPAWVATNTAVGVVGFFALGTVVNVDPDKRASLQVALVDGATGDILWANSVASDTPDSARPVTKGDFEENGLEWMVHYVFKEFP